MVLLNWRDDEVLVIWNTFSIHFQGYRRSFYALDSTDFFRLNLIYCVNRLYQHIRLERLCQHIKIDRLCQHIKLDRLCQPFWSQWSLNETISYLCKLTIQEAAGGCYTVSITTKMTISQEPLVEIDQTLCQNVSCMSCFDFLNGTISNLCKLTIQDGRQGPLLKIA